MGPTPFYDRNTFPKFMRSSLVNFIRKRFQPEEPLHPIDRQAAKYWVKRRLAHIFPELKDDPAALEQAYRELSLEPHAGSGEGGATLFEMHLPGRL